jgi:asparagine synthase (glutamine-hydrolysing)
MCGIAGIVNPTQLQDGDPALLRRMCDVIKHRGPDDEGFHFTGQAGIGIRRLSIIDLQTGHQPVLSEDGSVAVVLNGEIYNYLELRRDLEEKGHRFATQGDTETIVHGYEEYGDECIRRLRGMFCFALWDEKKKRLLLARDRVGIKQLYYTTRNGALSFGSEIKCLLQDPAFRRKIRAQSLLAYLTFLYTPAPDTIYEGVSELPPAHYLAWENGSIRVQRYWRLEFRVEGGHQESYYVEGLLAKLDDAVQSHLVSDVPLGAFLSGGIDSSTVVALMSREAGGGVETFTVGFEGKVGFYDERKEAKIIAERYRTKHHEFLVQPDVSDVLPRIIRAFDQPHADSSSIPNYYICQLARQHVTVALSGMGGDEMTGGYERYLGVLLGGRYRAVPGMLRRFVASSAGMLSDFGGKGRFSAARLKRFVESAEHDPMTAYGLLLSTFNHKELADLAVGELKNVLQNYTPAEVVGDAFRFSGTGDLVHQMLFTDLTGYLPGDLLQLTDRMSMIHSLEVRVPFLDHELLEFAATIPSDLKIRKLTKKYILQKISKRFLPEEIVTKEKRGFSIPLTFWMRNDLNVFVTQMLDPQKIEKLGYFSPATVSRLVQEHSSGRANHENKLWALVMFCAWHDLYMDGQVQIP